ncbi:MAG: cupin domain-containing protein [Rhodobacter sp.]|nr:cupin domain-containing protein [Rhodobacter sp.]
MTEDDHLRAALMTLGLLDPADEADARRQEADDPGFAALAAHWAERFDAADPVEPQAPSAGLWDRISDRVDDAISAPETHTHRRDAGIWEPLGPGIERKVVHTDRAAGTLSYFVRMQGGATLPIHTHEMDEQCILLEGRLRIGDLVFEPGDFQLAHAGGKHVPIHAQTDCLFFIHGAL